MDTDLKIAKSRETNYIPQDQINIAVTPGYPDSHGRPRPQLAVIARPYFASREFWAYWPRWMRQALPQFSFNPRASRYEAPIEELPLAVRALKDDWQVSLSTGAATYMEDFSQSQDGECTEKYLYATHTVCPPCKAQALAEVERENGK